MKLAFSIAFLTSFLEGQTMYNYVIIGAGSAGCVLANRLSENPHNTVLLLEAGCPDNRKEIHIPAAWSRLFKSECDWAYETEPQPQLNNRKLYWPRGKMLGGTSSLNAMIYSRANRADHDRWRDLGNEGWGYEDVLPSYKKAENNERGASEYHGIGGPLNVSDLRYVNPLTRTFVEAAVEAGLPLNEDFNGASQEGVGIFQVTQKNGKRCSSATAYLKPSLQRRNLTVQTGAHVTRLLFDRHRVAGVAYVRDGQTKQASVRGEVILCGGAINSPQVLMLSGIGPADHLRSMDIPVIVDLPGVGQNLQDHPLVGVELECTKPVGLADAGKMVDIARYLLFRNGPLSSNVGEAAAFIRTRAGLDAPDIEFLFAPVFYMGHGFDNPAGHGFAIGIALQHPESRGHIGLRSNDPLAPAVIQPNYLSSESDLTGIVEGVKIGRQIAQAKAFEPYRGKELWPGPDAQNDEGVMAFIRRTLESCYHPVGSCKMGNDSMAVVDDSLRVHGIEGVRVVDASVFPTHITGHPNAPIIMMAEKAAAMIVGENAGLKK
jgi:choline dehydrogenase